MSSTELSGFSIVGDRSWAVCSEELPKDGDQELAVLCPIYDRWEAFGRARVDQRPPEQEKRARAPDDHHDVQSVRLAKRVLGLARRDDVVERADDGHCTLGKRPRV